MRIFEGRGGGGDHASARRYLSIFKTVVVVYRTVFGTYGAVDDDDKHQQDKNKITTKRLKKK